MYSIGSEGRAGLLVEGGAAGCLDAPPLTLHLLQAEKLRVPWGGVFRSLQRHLLDVGGSEEAIVRKLFGGGDSKEGKEVLGGVMKSAIGAVWEAVEGACGASWDALGLLLTLALAAAHKKGHQGKGFKGMTAYCDRIGLLVWPRWKVVYDHHLQSLKALGVALGGGAGGKGAGAGAAGASAAGAAGGAPRSALIPPADPTQIHPLTLRFSQFKASVLFLHRTALMGAGPPLEDPTLPQQLCVEWCKEARTHTHTRTNFHPFPLFYHHALTI